MPSVLLFGATGEIGSHLVVAFKKAYPNISLTVYLRNKDVDDYMTSTVGVDRIVHGDFSELQKISSLAGEHDFVINCGSSMNVPLSKAIIEGFRNKPSRAKSTLIHISGAGNFIDQGKNGEFNADSRPYNDAIEDDMKLIHPGMLNGGPDVAVLEAGKDGKIATYIIFPSAVYGASIGPVKALGVIQLLMTLKAKELGFVPYVGSGSSIFNSIHVKDVYPFILKVFDLALNKEPEGSPYSRCYIIGGQNNQWKDVSSTFAQVLHGKGVINSSKAKSVKLEEMGEGEIPHLMGANMVFKNDRAVRLGFQPRHPSLVDHLHAAMEGYDL